MTDIKALLKDSKAEYRQLGKSGLRVSVPILGAMSIGDKAWQPWVIEEEESLPLLKAAYDKGINTWDTGLSSPHISTYPLHFQRSMLTALLTHSKRLL
jgi:predicted aldo/keto reductase-like oxidoreductase